MGQISSQANVTPSQNGTGCLVVKSIVVDRNPLFWKLLVASASNDMLPAFRHLLASIWASQRFAHIEVCHGQCTLCGKNSYPTSASRFCSHCKIYVRKTTLSRCCLSEWCETCRPPSSRATVQPYSQTNSEHVHRWTAVNLGCTCMWPHVETPRPDSSQKNRSGLKIFKSQTLAEFITGPGRIVNCISSLQLVMFSVKHQATSHCRAGAAWIAHMVSIECRIHRLQFLPPVLILWNLSAVRADFNLCWVRTWDFEHPKTAISAVIHMWRPGRTGQQPPGTKHALAAWKCDKVCGIAVVRESRTCL